MGADIYLNSRSDEARKKWEPIFQEAARKRDEFPRGSKEADELQKKVDEAYNNMYPDDGYFRDSYNATSLFWVLGLSWWQLSKELLDEEAQLPIDKAKELLARFETGDAQWSDERFDDWVTERREKEDWKFGADGEGNTVDEWRQYFKEKHSAWIALLKSSIELNEPLFWST